MTNGWHVGKFGDVLEPVSRPVKVEADKVYRNLGVQWYAYGLFVREEKPGHEIQAKELYRVELGDLVYNRLFAWKGSFAIADKHTAGGFVSGEFPCFRVDANRADAKYLHLYLSQEKIWEDIERTSTGQTSISRLRFKEPAFLNMDIPLPPLEEQHRIVERVEALATRIAKVQSLRDEADIEAKNLFQSRVNELLEEKSNSWKMATLPEFVSSNRHSVKRGPFGSHLRKEFFVEDGYKIYEQKHAIYGDFKAGRYYIDENKFQELKSFEVKPGDLIISCSGTIGKVAIVPENAKPGIINQALLKITLDTKKIDRRFFKLVFESDFIKREVEAISPGSAMKNIGSVKILKKILFPLPPLDEQRRIVAYLDSVQARLASLRELQSQTQEELDALLPSVLEKAFKGES